METISIVAPSHDLVVIVGKLVTVFLNRDANCGFSILTLITRYHVDMASYQIEKKLDSLSDADLIAVVQKQMKQRQDSIESYRSAGRDDLLKKEEVEASILKTYLPKSLSVEELEALIQSVITEVGATGRSQVGLVMKTAITRAAGRADGKSINTMALKLLGP